MDQKAGYKKTKIGWIPEDWVFERLDCFLDLITYGFTNPMPTSDIGPLLITALNVNNGKILYDTCRKTTQEAFDTLLTDKSRPKRNDILLTKDGTLGRVAVVGDEKCCINQSVALLRPNRKINPNFLKQLLQAPKYQATMMLNAGGTSIKHIYITVVNKMPIGVPSIPEQRKIAEILTTVDDKILSIENQIQQTEQLKKGLMEKLLTEGIGHTEFKDTKIGKIPASWDIDKFENVMVLQRGFDLPVKKRETGKFPLVASNGVIDCHSNFKVKGPGVITGRSGTLGMVHFIEDDYWPLNTTLYAKEMYDNNPKYLYYFLKNFRIEKYGTGTGVPTLNRNYVHKVDVAIPPIEEQKQIASILSTVDDKIDILNQKKFQYQTLKKGLSQQLLTGQMRVKV